MILPVVRRSIGPVIVVLIAVMACNSPAQPAAFQAMFALRAAQGKPLPLPDGGSLLVGDSLGFNEEPPPRGETLPRIRATVVHRNADGSVTITRGFQTYQRHGDTVITSFFCRFSDICLAMVVPPSVGVIRNDSLVFGAAGASVPERTYVRTR